MASPELTALSIENAPKPEVTSEGQAAAERIAANRQLRDSGMSARDARQSLNGSVSANQLAQPAAAAPVTEPAEAPPVNRGVIDKAAAATEEYTRATSQEAKDLDKARGEFAALSGEGSLADMFTGGLADAGVPDYMKELTDIQLQLADRGTQSQITQSRIGQGNSIAQANREITQETREAAIRDAGLAARAQVLQGNIETASTLVNQAVQLAYQDRTLRNTNLINQINDLRGVVDDQTQQILDKEQRKYEEDQAMIQKVETTVADALQSGAASASEVSFLTDPSTTDNERLAAAQLIQARGATEMRDLQTQSARMDVAVKAEQLARLREPVVATRDTKVVEVGDQTQLIDTQTGDVIATFGADVSADEVSQARDVNYVNTVDGLKTHPGLNTSVGPTFLTRVPGIDTFGNKDDFIASTENVLKKLTMQTYQEAKEAGATFGAMQQAEWDMLAEAATKISQTRVYEKEGFPGFRSATQNVKGYDLAEDDFLSELDLISNFGKMNAVRNGASPEEMGVVLQDDGMYATFNHDGSVTLFEIGQNNQIIAQ